MKINLVILTIIIISISCSATHRTESDNIIYESKIDKSKAVITDAAEKEEEVIDDGESAKYAENLIYTTTLTDQVLKSSLYGNDTVTKVPANSKVQVLDYKEDGLRQGYYLVKYKDINGYLYDFSVRTNNRMKFLVEIEKKEISRQNVELFEDLKEIKNKIEFHKAWVTPLTANIRVSHSLNSQVQDKLERGSVVFIQSSNNGWFKIMYDEPEIDFNSHDEDYISDIVNKYNNRSRYLSEYKVGWIYNNIISTTHISKLSYAGKRRWSFVEKNPQIKDTYKTAIKNGQIILGMTRDMVIASWGKPSDINRSVGSWGTHEQWVYSKHYLYFENNILTSWQD